MHWWWMNGCAFPILTITFAPSVVIPRMSLSLRPWSCRTLHKLYALFCRHGSHTPFQSETEGLLLAMDINIRVPSIRSRCPNVHWEVKPMSFPFQGREPRFKTPAQPRLPSIPSRKLWYIMSISGKHLPQRNGKIMSKVRFSQTKEDTCSPKICYSFRLYLDSPLAAGALMIVKRLWDSSVGRL